MQNLHQPHKLSEGQPVYFFGQNLPSASEDRTEGKRMTINPVNKTEVCPIPAEYLGISLIKEEKKGFFCHKMRNNRNKNSFLGVLIHCVLAGNLLCSLEEKRTSDMLMVGSDSRV